MELVSKILNILGINSVFCLRNFLSNKLGSKLLTHPFKIILRVKTSDLASIQDIVDVFKELLVHNLSVGHDKCSQDIFATSIQHTLFKTVSEVFRFKVFGKLYLEGEMLKHSCR